MNTFLDLKKNIPHYTLSCNNSEIYYRISNLCKICELLKLIRTKLHENKLFCKKY